MSQQDQQWEYCQLRVMTEYPPHSSTAVSADIDIEFMGADLDILRLKEYQRHRD